MSVAVDGVEFAQVAQGFYLEALLIDGAGIWYTDVVRGGVRKVGSDEVLLGDRTLIGGLLLNQDGRLLVSGSAGDAGGIAWVDPTTGVVGSLLTSSVGVNEMHALPDGGMIFGTIDLTAILRDEKPSPSPSTIERMDAAGALTCLREGLTFANGLALSPDGTTIYFNESFSASRAFPIEADGSLSEPRTLIDMYDCDGMALDAEGNIWVTGFGSAFLRCIRPDGTEVRRLSLPGLASTNVRFAGPDMMDLYVTIVDPQAARALAEGRPIERQDSAIFHTRSPVPGAVPAKTRLRL